MFWNAGEGTQFHLGMVVSAMGGLLLYIALVLFGFLRTDIQRAAEFIFKVSVDV